MFNVTHYFSLYLGFNGNDDVVLFADTTRNPRPGEENGKGTVEFWLVTLARVLQVAWLIVGTFPSL